jgi:hypothetical protein
MPSSSIVPDPELIQKQVFTEVAFAAAACNLCELPLTRDKDAEISAGAMAAMCRRQA